MTDLQARLIKITYTKKQRPESSLRMNFTWYVMKLHVTVKEFAPAELAYSVGLIECISLSCWIGVRAKEP